MSRKRNENIHFLRSREKFRYSRFFSCDQDSRQCLEPTHPGFFLRMVKFGSKMQFSQKDLFYFYTFPKLWCQRSASPYHLRNWPESNADSNLPPGPSYKYIPHWSPKSKRLLLRGEGMVLGIWRHHFWSWPTNTTRATNTLTRCHKVSPHLGNMIHIVFILKFYSVRLLQNGDLFYISFSKLLC